MYTEQDRWTTYGRKPTLNFSESIKHEEYEEPQIGEVAIWQYVIA